MSLASKFFCVLGLEPCVLDSTSAKNRKTESFYVVYTTVMYIVYMIMLYRHYIIRGPFVMFEVEYLWKDWVKKDGVDVNLV